VVLTSAASVVAMLDETDSDLQVHALQQLLDIVDHHWVEISDSVNRIEEIFDDESFPKRELAAAVASRTYYHMAALDEALRLALGAGEYFNIAESSEYVQTLISKAVDAYVSYRTQVYDTPTAEAKALDPRLERIVEKMFQRCCEDGENIQALGIAVEARRLDLITESFNRAAAEERPALLAACFRFAQRTVTSHKWRREILATLATLYRTLAVPDYFSMCECFLFLDDHKAVADTLTALVQADLNQALVAYQVAFDLQENQNYAFLIKVSEALPRVEEVKSDATEDSYALRMRRLTGILSGEIPTDLQLHFLYGQNKTDLNVVKGIKDKLEPRNSVTHNATVMAHALFQCGTTVDAFLRDEMEWLSKAMNWAKFTATASFGVVHKGHIQQSSKILEAFLPQGGAAFGSSASAFQEGGALYALGLIHSSHGKDKVPYLLEALKCENEIVQHGACLGLGLCAMATANDAIYETLKTIVFKTDNAVAGEAAGLAMGMLMLGSCNGDAMQEMVSYAQDTKHEKITRGLSVGVAMVVFGCEEAADPIILTMLQDKDPILRYGGVYAVALAYAATSNKSAIKKLLHYAGSDVSDEVRRAAVTGLGFVLANEPEEVPRIVGLLSESYNGHVRYGAAMAVGIAAAGSGNKAALDLIEPLLKDKTDYVRQAAFIAMSMILIQRNAVEDPRTETLRKAISDSLMAKGDHMTKFGSILAAGILDAAGRNATIELLSPGGHKRTQAIIGLALFQQFWYWYPLVHFLSLSFTPTAVIGLNKDLRIPEDFTFTSAAPPSRFAYPPPIETKKKEEKKRIAPAQLSVTAKARAKAKKKAEGDDGAAPMDVEAAAAPEAKAEEPAAAPAAPAPAAPEPASVVIHNPSRVTPSQRKVIVQDLSQRYRPLKKNLQGVVMLADTKAGEPEKIYAPKAPKIGTPGVSDDEPAPPEPFECTR